MQPAQFKYPVFEANQVLTNAHLNQSFNYLDEQERLTRANLIGIGIVCGLEISLTPGPPAAIHLTKGCGITSEGYLIVEPVELSLVAYRAGYKVPDDSVYLPFLDPATQLQYPLWELLPQAETGTSPLDAPASFLQDKAVLLFLELKKEGLRNCSPNNCNDKGAEVTATVRRLLIQAADLVKIIARANQLAETSTAADLENTLSARLKLPDLRLPRFDVLNTGPATSQDVLTAFFAALYDGQVVSGIQAALTAAYDAFRPLLAEGYPGNPFANFNTRFAFLDKLPATPVLPTPAQVRFLQYFYDLFDDLLKGYQDFCRQGQELLCACCPAGDLFPRHLMLGLLQPAAVPDAAIYRHPFLASAAVSGCEEKTAELVLLFQRLVEMVAQFTSEPPLPALPANALTDVQIRVTPSYWGDKPVAGKAIPYYYLQTGTPPLYQVWDPGKSRRRRAHLNLSYRADEYVPTAPLFVRQPLQYDLEGHNFLRVEGHLGKDYRSVLRTLLSLKTQYRLPIEVLALRTGAFDEKMPVDISQEAWIFQDLETLYDVTRERIQSSLSEGVMYLYGIAVPGSKDPGGIPALPLLKAYAPNYRHLPGTVGAWYERNLVQVQSIPYIDVDQQKIDLNAVLGVYCILFGGTTPLPGQFFAHAVSIYYLSKLSEILPPALSDLGFDDFQNKYQDLIGLTRYFRSEKVGEIPVEMEKFIPQEDLIDHFDHVLFSSELEPVRAIREEFNRRIKETRQKQFLSYFLQKHPGIQHKAGVPLGGTFIIVYHDDPDTLQVRPEFDNLFDLSQVPAASANRLRVSAGTSQLLSHVFTRISVNPLLARDPDIRLLLGTFTGFVPDRDVVPPALGQEAVEKVIAETVQAMTDGTVIADFFLPYICCSSAPAIQYVLPKTPLTFTVLTGCTNAGGEAEITITPEGGMEPYSVKVDDLGFQPLSLVRLLQAGPHQLVLKDAEGTESKPRPLEIPGQLRFGEPSYDCIGDGNAYTTTIAVHGGTPPYLASQGTVQPGDDTWFYTSDTLPGSTDTDIVLTDSRQCTAAITLNHSCLPDLAFTFTLACTNADGQAQVQILPTGGKPPYLVHVSTGDTSPLSDTGSIFLQAGAHDLVVIDDQGQSTPPQTVVVPLPITLGSPEFTCIGENNTYTTTFQFSGGTPPYQVQRGTVEPQADGTFRYRSDNLPGNQDTDIIIADSRQCFASQTVNHCCLPCEGQSRRCGYRLWIQPPVEGPLFQAYRQGSAVEFRFNGENLELPGAAGLLQIPVVQLNNDFQSAMKEAVEKLNKSLSEALAKRFGAAIGPQLFQVTYTPTATDPFGLIGIEHFVCHTFHLQFSFTFAKPSPTFSLVMRYTNEPDVTGAPFQGAVLFNSRAEKETRTPAFDCSERNQCAGSDYEKLCKGPDPKITFNFDGIGENRFIFIGEVENMAPAEIAAWVWDFFDAQPTEPFYVGDQTEAALLKPGGIVRLTAITQTGCYGIIERNINQ